MASESKSHGLGKGDLRRIFDDKYEEWIAENIVVEKTKHPSATVLVEQDRVETNSALPEHQIHGFKNEIKSMENFLLDQKVYNEFKSLVLVGEYGVGKTTLCKMLFNNEVVKCVYAPRIWISMHSYESRDGKIYVLKKILNALVLEDDMFESNRGEVVEDADTKQESGGIDDGAKAKEMELCALLYEVNLNLKWKKYLIVFDDVRKGDNWTEKLDEKVSEDEKWGKHLSDGFPKGSGGRVIYTTRKEKLAKKLVAEEHEIHRLWPLSDPKSVWDIYEAALVENGKEIPRKDQKCIEELMNKSCGLPLAARLMGKRVPVFAPDKTV